MSVQQQSVGWSLRNFRKTPFGCLLHLFLTRMFQGNSDSSADELNLGIAAILSLLAVPSLLISMLMFEKYGSLLRFIRGGTSAVFDFDPFVAAIPDEYFFVVLSIVITGAATLWRWDAIFLDRRDYTNLVPLPDLVKNSLLRKFLRRLRSRRTLCHRRQRWLNRSFSGRRRRFAKLSRPLVPLRRRPRHRHPARQHL